MENLKELSSFVDSTFTDIRRVLQIAQKDAADESLRKALESAEAKLDSLWSQISDSERDKLTKDQLAATIGKLDGIKATLIELAGRDTVPPTTTVPEPPKPNLEDTGPIPTFDPVEVRPDTPCGDSSCEAEHPSRHRIWESWLEELRDDARQRGPDPLDPVKSPVTLEEGERRLDRPAAD